MEIKRIKPKINSLLDMRAIAFSNLKDFSFLQRLKIRSAYLPIAILFSKYLFNNFYILIQDHKLLAFIIIRRNKIRSLFVKLDVKGRGYGSVLLDYVESACKIKGYKFIYLKPTTQAKPFYEKRGYKKNKFYWYKDL